MTGVSVICLLFPLRAQKEENLRGRTKGGKNHNFEQRAAEKRTIIPLRSVLNFFLSFFFFSPSFHPALHPFSHSLSHSFSFFLPPVLLVSRGTCGRDGRDGGVGQSKRMKNE